jgi:hypothetical protein
LPTSASGDSEVKLPPWKTSRVDLPTAGNIILLFDLHENPEKFHERTNRDLLFEVFPDTQMVTVEPRYNDVKNASFD